MRTLNCFCLFLALLLLVGCSSAKRLPVDAILSAMLSVTENAPAGAVYRSTAEEGESTYFSDSLFASLYGNGTLPRAYADIDECAVYLSRGAEPFEIAVFLCTSHDAIPSITELCHARIRLLRQFFRGSDEEETLAAARVLIIGNYVLMVIAPNTEELLSEGKRVLN